MGNSESQNSEGGSRASSTALPEMRTCYYEILEVERSDATTADDIKRAYRRLALKYHPDKNHENTQAAAEKFIQIQAAYEVLSDEQERAWYDSHREQILRGTDGDNAAQDKEVVGTTVEDLMKFFDPSTFSRMNDSPKGFYTILRTLFGSLDGEEEAAAREVNEDHVTMPSFGDSRSDPKDVRSFYSAWLAFSTVKSFSWRDQWKYSDAPDRRIKRAMEKDNKKHRDAGRREFNDTVKSLVMFIRKRDPRYVKETFDEAKLQASLLAASQSQAARAKAAFQENVKTFETQDWMAVDETMEEESQESEVEEEYECIACKKIYKNEKQFEAHLKGKKHLKAVQALRRSMRQEDENLGVSDPVSTHGTATPDASVAQKPFTTEPSKANGTLDVEEESVESDVEELHHTHRPNTERLNAKDMDETHSESSVEIDNNRRNAKQTVGEEGFNSGGGDSDVELERELDKLYLGVDHTNKQRPPPADGKPKIGAAKAKRQKRAEKQATLDAESRSPQKPRKSRKPFDPSAAVQKARGETVTTGRRTKKK